MVALRPATVRNVSLKIVIFLTCVALICACAGAVAIATYATNSSLIVSIAERSFERSGVETINNTDYLLKPVAAAIDATATAIQDDVTSISKPNLSRFLYNAVALYPQVYSAYVSSEQDGRFAQVQRIDPSAKTWGPRQKPIPRGSRYALRSVSGEGAERRDDYRYITDWSDVVGSETVQGSTYDPRVRPFYRDAAARQTRVLTDIYTFASNGKPGITIARRLDKDGAFVGVVAADITLERMSEFLAAQPVGQHGVALIVDAEGRIIAAPPSRRANDGAAPRTVHDVGGAEITDAWRLSGTSPPTFTFTSGGRDYLAAIRHFPADFDKNWTIMEVAPVDDFVGELKSTFRAVTVFSLLVACLAGIGSLVIAGRITKPLDGLTLEADRIRSLMLDGPISGRSRIREIQHLIESMAAMKTALRTLAGEDTDRTTTEALVDGSSRAGPHSKLFQRVVEKVELRRARETELALASDIQHSVLPRQDGGPARGASIRARMRAAREVGGDFYDWLWRDDGRLIFVIGDVSGKGVPAALLMISARTAIRTMIMAGSGVSDIVTSTNRLLSENNDSCFFVTVFIGELDVATGRLTYINAGHEPARLMNRGAELDLLMPAGPALGVIEDARFETRTVELGPGCTVVVYTDGVIDAVDRSGDRFGDDRARAVLKRHGSRTASEMVEGLFDAVDDFAGDEMQFDDITCVVLRYDPAAPGDGGSAVARALVDAGAEA